MICWDCQEGLGEQRPAAAVCERCGAAVCVDHAVRREVRLTATVGANGRQVPVATPGRRIRCRVCDSAERDREFTTDGAPARRGRR